MTNIHINNNIKKNVIPFLGVVPFLLFFLKKLKNTFCSINMVSTLRNQFVRPQETMLLHNYSPTSRILLDVVFA